ncbi:hypothetical protein HH308_18325 [Gordonia sp. TBRC 11910]|uniref:Uncharacterized protein n=1 Tax=Gordonia asplenii TaxID=2725283 RepID=A0A848L3J7_9ACTN|nr:hypothetical protein [Gordonia asplenii]NMO03173.1 hypothetical protein [Gordonia asplenii]
MSHPSIPEPGGVQISGRRTPMVLSVARCLREGLARGAEVPAGTDTVTLMSASDAQKAHVSVVDGELIVAADATADAENTWQVRWSDPTPSRPATDDFASAIAALLTRSDVDWRTAADAFWTRAAAAPGMPIGLNVCCADDESVTELGDHEPDGQGVFGTAAALTSFFQGRSTLFEVLEGGEFGINMTFPVFSALFGANQKVVCGEL